MYKEIHIDRGSRLWWLLPSIFIFSIFSVIGGALVQAQHPDLSVIYTQTQSGETSFISANDQDELLVLPVDTCFAVSSNNQHVVALGVQVRNELSIYSLNTGLLITNLVLTTVLADPCGIDWKDSETVTVRTDWNVNQYVEIDILTGIASDPILFDLNEELPNLSIDGEFSFLMQSPDGEKYLYERCDEILQTVSGLACGNSSNLVIYDLQTMQIVGELGNPPLPPARPVSPRNYFSWSYSGDYLAYRAGANEPIGILNLISGTEVDLSFIDSDVDWINIRSSGIQWSHNETQIAIWVDRFSTIDNSRTSEFVEVDLENESWSSTSMPFEDAPEQANDWGWSSTGTSIFALGSDGTLVELDIATGQRIGVVSQNVRSLYIWHEQS